MKSYSKLLVPLLAALILVTALLAYPATAQDKKTDKPAVTAADDNTVAAKRLSRKQKRDLGILPRQVIPLAREMAKQGDITKDMTKREIAFAYAVEVSGTAEYGGAWKGVSDGTYGVEWDELIEFLERLFELLMKFIPLFL